MDLCYDQKFDEMKKYIPFLDNMIKKLESTTSSVGNPRQAQLNKIRSLRDLLLDKKKRMKMENLLKCEQVLVNLYAKVEQRESLPGIKKPLSRSDELDQGKFETIGHMEVKPTNPDTLPEIARASETDTYYSDGNREPALFHRRPFKASPNDLNAEPALFHRRPKASPNLTSPNRYQDHSSPGPSQRNYTRVLTSPDPNSRRSEGSPSSTKSYSKSRSPRKYSKYIPPNQRKKYKKKVSDEETSDLNITLNVPEESLDSLNTADILSRIINCDDNDVDIDKLRDLRSQILGELKQTGAKEDISDLIMKSYKKKKDDKTIKGKKTEVEEGELSDSESEAIQNIYGSLVVVDDDSNKDSSSESKAKSQTDTQQRKIQICLVINPDKDENDHVKKLTATEFQNKLSHDPSEFEAYDSDTLSKNPKKLPEVTSEKQVYDKSSSTNTTVDAKPNTDNDCKNTEDSSKYIIMPKICKETELNYTDIIQSSKKTTQEVSNTINHVKSFLGNEINANINLNPQATEKTAKIAYVCQPENKNRDTGSSPVVTPENKPLAMINSILFPKKNDNQVSTPSTKDLPYRPNFYKPIHEEKKIASNIKTASIAVQELQKTGNLKEKIYESESLKCISTSSNNQENLSTTAKKSIEVIKIQNKELINKCQFNRQDSIDTGLTNLNTVVIPLIDQESEPSKTMSKTEPKIVSEIDILRALKSEILNENIPVSSDENGTPALHAPKLTKVASGKEILNKKRISIERYKEKSCTPSKPGMINDSISGDDIGKKQSLKLTDKECERFNFPVKIPLEVVSSEDEDPETIPSDKIYKLAPKSPDYDILSDSETSEPVIIPAEPVKRNEVNLNSKGDIDMRKITPVVPEIAKQLVNIKDATKHSPTNINAKADTLKNKIPEKKPVLVDPRLSKRDADVAQKKSSPQTLILNQERTPLGTGRFPNMTPNMTTNARTYEITPTYSPIESDEPKSRQHVYAPLISNTNSGARNDMDYRSHSVHKEDSFDDRSRYHHSLRSDGYNHRRNSYVNDEYEPYNRQDCPSTPNHPFGRSEFSNIHPTKWSDCPPTPSHAYGRQDAPMTPVHPFGRIDAPTTPVHPFGRLDVPTTSIHPFSRQDAPMTPVHPFGRHDAPMTPVHPFGRSDNPTPSSLFDRSECPPTPNHPFGRSDMPRTPSHPFGRSDSSSNHINRFHTSSEHRRFYQDRNDRNFGRGNEYNRNHSESYRLNNREHNIRTEKYKHDRYYNDNSGYNRDQNRRSDKPLFNETDRNICDESDRNRQYIQRENSGIHQPSVFEHQLQQREPIAGRHHQLANQRARSIGKTYPENPTRENTLSFKPDTGKSFTIDTSINRSFQELLKVDKHHFDNSFNARSQRASSVGRSLVREPNSATNNKISEYDSVYLNDRNKFTRALSVGREMCNNKNKNRSEIKADFEAFSRKISTKRGKTFDSGSKTPRKDANESDRGFKDKQKYQNNEKLATAISTKQIYSPRKNPRDPRLRYSRNNLSPSAITDKKDRESSSERKKHGIVYSSDNIAKGNIMGPGYGVKNYRIPKIKRTVDQVEEKEAKEPVETAKSIDKSESKVEIKSITSKNTEVKKGNTMDIKKDKINPSSHIVTTSPEKRVTRSSTRTDTGKQKLSENEQPQSNEENELKVDVLVQKSDLSYSETTKSTIDKIDEFLNLGSDQDLNEQEESLESSFGIGDLELFSENMVGDPVLENINALIAGLDNDINTKETEQCNAIENRISIVDDILLNKLSSPDFENILQKTEEINENTSTNPPSVKDLPSSVMNEDSRTSFQCLKTSDICTSKEPDSIDSVKENTKVEERSNVFEKEPVNICYEESNEIKNNESEDIVSTSNTNVTITDQVQEENADSNFGLTPDSTNNPDITESEKGLPDSTNDTQEMNSDVSSTHEPSLPVSSQKKESELGSIENLLTLLQDNGKIKDLLSKFGSQLNDNKKLKKKLLKLSELISDDEDSDEPTKTNEIDFDENIISEDVPQEDSDKYIPNDINNFEESFKQNSDSSIQVHEKQSEKKYEGTATEVTLVSEDTQTKHAATKKPVDMPGIQNVSSMGHESNVINCNVPDATTVNTTHNEESRENKLPATDTVNVAIISNSGNSLIEDKVPANCCENNIVNYTITNATTSYTTQNEESAEICLPATDTVNIDIISNSGNILIKDKIPTNNGHEDNIVNSTITNVTIGNNTSHNEEFSKIKLPATHTVNIENISNSIIEDETPANIKNSATIFNNINTSHNDLTAQGPSQAADNNENKTSNESQVEPSEIEEISNEKLNEINETNKTNKSENEIVSITKKAISSRTTNKKKGKPKKVPPKKQKKIKRLTRSAFINQKDQTKAVKTKKRNELEKLKDDIKEMFLTDDVLNTSGIRMCRLAKLVEETNVSGCKESTEATDPKDVLEKVIKTVTTEDSSAKKPLKKKSARKSMPVVADVKAQVKSNVPSPKARVKPGLKPKNKDTKNSELSDPYVFESDSIGESSTTKASENSDPSSSDSDDESLATSRSVGSSDLLVEYKKKPKRKRKGWQAGVIKTKRKTKKNSALDSSLDEDEPLFLQRPFEIPDYDCYTDKTYCFLKNKLTYSCRFCKFNGDDIVTHYKKNHPHSEIPLSRMSPSLAREAIEQCEEDNFQAISKMPTDKYVCRFCYKEFGITKRKSNLEIFFWHVVSKHTGEYKQLCSECVNVTRCPFNLDIPPPPKDVGGQLIGYICGKCNFTQISLENLKTHVIDRHNDEQTEVFTINLAVMSRKTITALSKKCKTQKRSRTLRSSHSNQSVTDQSEEQSDITESDTLKYEVPIEFDKLIENEPSSSSRIQAKLSFETDDSDVSHKMRNEEEMLETIKAEHLADESETTLNALDNNHAEEEKVSEVGNKQATHYESESSDVNRHPHFQVKYTSTGSKEYVCCINDSGLHYKTTLLISMKKHVQLKHSEKWDGYCYICKVIVTPLGQYLFKDCLEHYLDKHIDEFPVYDETSQQSEPVGRESNAPTISGEVQKPIINVRPLCQLLSVDNEVPESELVEAVTTSPSFETETIDALHSSALVQTSQPSPTYPVTRKEIAEPKEHRYEEVQAEVMSRKHRVVLDTMMAKNKLIQVFKCAGHYCSFTTDSVEDALMHVSTHQRIGGDNAMNCAYCDFDSSGNFIDLVSHVFKNHGRCQFVCSRCFYRAAASQLVGAHMLRVHGESPRPGSVLKTTVVTMSDDDNSDLLSRETAVPYYVCKQANGDGECTFRTYTCGKFGEHLMQNHANDTTFLCNSCPETVSSAAGLMGHLKQHGYKLYQCTWCVFGADNEAQLLAHASSKHYYKPPQAYLRIITNKEGSSDLRVLPLASLNKTKIPFEEVSLNPQNEDPTKEAERASDLEKLIGQTKFMITPLQTTPAQTTLVQPGTVAETPIETDALESDALETEDIGAKAAQPSGTKTPEPILNTADILTDSSSSEKDRSRSATPILETEDTTSSKDIPVKVKTELAEELPAKEKFKESEVICLDSDEEEVNEEIINQSESHPQKTEAGLPNIKVPLTELLRCPKCQFLGSNVTSFRKHLNRCFPFKDVVVVCKHCSLNIELRHLIVHYKVHCDNPDYRCSVCGLTKASLYTIKRHIKADHGASYTTISEISPNCYVVSANYPVRKDAHKRKIPPSAPAPAAATPTKLKRYGPLDVDKLPINPIIDEVFCSLCKFSTKVRLNMVRHLQCHEQQQAVPNSAPVNPVPHLESNEKHFDRMVNLAASSGAVDKAKYDSGPVTSHVPPESLSRFPKYVPARQRHTCGAKGCSYISLDEAMLKCHWETLHSGPTEYLCVHCPSSQQVDTSKPLTAKRIIGHLKMHDVRLYACSSCSYYHHKRPIVEKHISANHGVNKAKVMVVREDVGQQPMTPVVQSTSTAPTPTMDLRPWQCGLCKFKSMLRAEVVDHCFKFHQSKMQFKCSYCPFRTSAIENVTKHQAVSHANKQEAVFYYYYHAGSSIPDEADGTPRWVKQRNQSGQAQVKTEIGEPASKLTTATAPNPVLAPTNPITADRVEVNLDIVKSEINDEEEEESTEELCLTFGPLGEPNGLLFKCPLCKTLTDACKETMQSHLYEELKYRKWGCNNCPYKAFHRKGLDEHMLTEHRQCRSVPIELPIDKKVEQWVSKVLRHQEGLIDINKENFAKQRIQNPVPSTSAPQKQTQKESQGYSFDTEDLEKAFGTLGSPVDMDYCCPKCQIRITDEQEMQNHLESELSKIRWSCSSCSRTFQNYHEAEFHCRSSCERSRPVVPASLRDPGLRAAWVSAVVTSQRLSINHPPKSTQHLEDNSNSLLAVRYEEPVQTPEGSASRKRPASESDEDKLVINEEDNDFEPGPSRRKVPALGAIQCPHCKFEGMYPSSMKVHRLRHFKLKAHACAYCHFDASQKQIVQKHQKTAHPGLQENVIKIDEPLGPPLVVDVKKTLAIRTCLVCFTNVNVKQDGEHSHTGVYSGFVQDDSLVIKCSICSVMFENDHFFKLHQKAQHPQTPPSFTLVKFDGGSFAMGL